MKPLHIIFKPSTFFSVLITILSVAASGILILLAWTWQIKLLLVMMILGSLAYVILERGLLLMPWSVIALDINVKNELMLMRRDGVLMQDLLVCPDSVVTTYLTIIRYQPKDAKLLQRLFSFYLVIFPDAVDAENFRRLRVWLRWGYTHKLR